MPSSVAARLRALADAIDTDAGNIVSMSLGVSIFDDGKDKSDMVLGLHLEFRENLRAALTKTVIERLYHACRVS